MKIFLRSFSEFLSGKYGCGSVFVAIGTAISVVLWFSGATAATSYILPFGITLVGELIKFSAFRQINDELRDKTEWLHYLEERNVFLAEENLRFEEEARRFFDKRIIQRIRSTTARSHEKKLQHEVVDLEESMAVNFFEPESTAKGVPTKTYGGQKYTLQ